MKALLDNRFAPTTFKWGFVESPFAKFSEAFIQWQDQLDVKFGTRSERKNFLAPLSESLVALEPLTTPLDRYLLTETRSRWSAIFANGGGPGMTTTGERSLVLSLYGVTLDVHDMVLFDDRGRGSSAAINCSDLQPGTAPFDQAVAELTSTAPGFQCRVAE